jgi:hypothetical protein
MQQAEEAELSGRGIQFRYAVLMKRSQQKKQSQRNIVLCCLCFLLFNSYDRVF